MITCDRRPLSRRTVLTWGGVSVPATVGAFGLSTMLGGHDLTDSAVSGGLVPFPELEELTIADLQAAMTSRELTARQLTEMYLAPEFFNALGCYATSSVTDNAPAR